MTKKEIRILSSDCICRNGAPSPKETKYVYTYLMGARYFSRVRLHLKNIKSSGTIQRKR